MLPTKEEPMIYETTKPADIQEVLKRIDPLILLKKIAEFRKLNVAQMTDEERRTRQDGHTTALEEFAKWYSKNEI